MAIEQGQNPELNLFPGGDEKSSANKKEKSGEETEKKSADIDLEAVKLAARTDTTIEVVKDDKERAKHKTDDKTRAAVQAKSEIKMTEKELTDAKATMQYTLDKLGEILKKGAGPVALKALGDLLEKAGKSDPKLAEDLKVAMNVLSSAMEESAKAPAALPAKGDSKQNLEEKAGKEAAVSSAISAPNPNEGQWGTFGDQESALNLGSTFGLGAPSNAVHKPKARGISGNAVEEKKDTFTEIEEARKREEKENPSKGRQPS